MTIEAILRLILLTTGVLALIVGFAAYHSGGKKRIRSVVLLLVACWSAVTFGGGLYLTPKVGSIVAVEGTLLGLAVIGALAGGLSAYKMSNGGAGPAPAAIVFGLLVLVDLTMFYRLNHKIVEMAGELGFGAPHTKYEPSANKDCPENLKSLYFAFAQYVDGNGSLPSAERWMDNDELSSKVQKEEWFHCPEVSNRHDSNYGYAYNDLLSQRKLNGKKLQEMPNAAKTPLLYDSSNLGKSAHDAFVSLPRSGRHGGRNNVLYCDGHVDAVRAGSAQP